MQATATAKTVRISPTKARLVTRLIQGRRVPEALQVLKTTPKKAARIVEQVLRSAVANAGNKEPVQEEDLMVRVAVADEGPRLKRYRPAARGRAMRYVKRTSHISVTVSD
jgi:large subunit ribosomal protein L22